MRVSVIIVSFNVAPLLRRCLESVIASAGEVEETEIIVVDNASSDDSVTVARETAPTAIILPWTVNRGFGTAVNAGAQIAKGEILLVLNPDAALRAGTMHQMIQRLNASDRIAAIGPRQTDKNGVVQLSTGPVPTLLNELGRKLLQYAFDRRWHWAESLLDRLLNEPRQVPWLAASALLLRAKAFSQIGGFDEKFFLYFEDIDLGLRLGAAGFEQWFVPGITVVHDRGQSARSASSLAEQAYRRSQLYFWEKHHGAKMRRLVELYLHAVGKWRG